jgi:phage terminase small subunit
MKKQTAAGVPATGQPLSNARHERFAHEYMVDLQAGNAARRAGYSERTADQSGYRLLRKPKISGRIAALQAEVTSRLEITVERVLLEAARLAFSDPRRLFDADGNLKPIAELDDDTAAALASFESVERPIPGGEGKTEVIRKVKTWSKPEAVTLLARHLGLLVDRIEHKHELSFLEGMTIDELRQAREYLRPFSSNGRQSPGGDRSSDRARRIAPQVVDVLPGDRSVAS